jgi:hypothetical protein
VPIIAVQDLLIVFHLIPQPLLLVFHLIPQPLLLEEKGCKNLIFSLLSPSPEGEGLG